MRVVIFPHNPLLLRGIKRDSSGSIRTGFVENGAWHFEARGNEYLAKAGNVIVSRWAKLSEIIEIPVSPDWRGDYNDIILLALESYHATHPKETK